MTVLLNHLPKELIQEIAGFSSPFAKWNLGQTSKYIRSCIQEQINRDKVNYYRSKDYMFTAIDNHKITLNIQTYTRKNGEKIPDDEDYVEKYPYIACLFGSGPNKNKDVFIYDGSMIVNNKYFGCWIVTRKSINKVERFRDTEPDNYRNIYYNRYHGVLLVQYMKEDVEFIDEVVKISYTKDYISYKTASGIKQRLETTMSLGQLDLGGTKNIEDVYFDPKSGYIFCKQDSGRNNVTLFTHSKYVYHKKIARQN